LWVVILEHVNRQGRVTAASLSSIALVWVAACSFRSPPPFGAPLGQQAGAEVAELTFDALGEILARGLPQIGDVDADNLDALQVAVEKRPRQATDLRGKAFTLNQVLNRRR